MALGALPDFDERGYLLCVERWGGDDGPDDAINPAMNLIKKYEDLVISGGTPIVTGSGAIPLARVR